MCQELFYNTRMNQPYKAHTKNFEHQQEDGTSWWGVDGPQDAGIGYYSHTLSPHLSMKTMEEAERAATLCNSAYGAGYRQAQYDMRKALGLD